MLDANEECDCDIKQALHALLLVECHFLPAHDELLCYPKSLSAGGKQQFTFNEYTNRIVNQLVTVQCKNVRSVVMEPNILGFASLTMCSVQL